jgi:phage gpG-like protein
MSSPVLSGLRTDSVIKAFDFSPSIGILARDVDKMGIDIRSFRVPLTEAVRSVMIPSIQANFQAGGRPDSWEPLSEATQVIRSRAGQSGPILVRSGALMRNMGYMTMWDITKDYAIIKQLPPRVWYGAVHQGGYENNVGTQINSAIKRAARKGVKLSPGQASKQVMAQLDAKLKSAMAGGGSAGGGSDRAHTIPARPFVMFQDEDLPKIDQVFDNWLKMRLVAASFKGG